MYLNILFVCCTHGDEPIGKYVFDNYLSGKNKYYSWQSIIANFKALKSNRRFIDIDLNRVFPGKQNGKYEEKRAYEINKILPKFHLVIDWHQSNNLMNDIIFVSRLNPFTKKICQYFAINHIVELDIGNQDYKGLLIFQVENSIAVEYANGAGTNNIYHRANRDITNLLNKRVVYLNKIYYRLFGYVSLKFKRQIKLENFKKLTDKELKTLNIKKENIYPIFVNTYPHIYCVLLSENNKYSTI